MSLGVLMQYFQTHQDTEACYNHRQINLDKHRKYIIFCDIFHIYFISRSSLPWNNVDEHFSDYGNYELLRYLYQQHYNGGAGNTAEYAYKYLVALNFSHF